MLAIVTPADQRKECDEYYNEITNCLLNGYNYKKYGEVKHDGRAKVKDCRNKKEECVGAWLEGFLIELIDWKWLQKAGCFGYMFL